MDKNRMMQKMKNLMTLILCSVLLLSGCSSIVPKARISNVTDKKVAKALWEVGYKREEFTVNDVMGHAIFGWGNPGSSITAWPSCENINKPHTTIKYDLDSAFDTWKCRDIIEIISENKDDILLSIKCEKKYVPFLNIIALFYPFYDRDYAREETLMVGTLQRLQKDKDVSIEWIGKWRPVQPIVIKQNGVKWIAFKGTDAHMAIDYLVKKGYEKNDISTSAKLLFGRYLTRDPFYHGTDNKTIEKRVERKIAQKEEIQEISERFEKAVEKRDGETIFHTIRQWESKEKILVKTTDTSDTKDEVVIVGITAMGYGYECIPSIGLFLKKRITVVDDKLITTVINDLRSLAYNYTLSNNYSQVIEFIDPSPWIEELAMEPLQSEFIKEMKKASK